MLTARCATGFRGHVLLSRPVPSGPRAGRVFFVDLVAKRTWILFRPFQYVPPSCLVVCWEGIIDCGLCGFSRKRLGRRCSLR